MTINISDKNSLIEYLRSNGFYAKHSLGQNFLIDQEVLEKIVESADLASVDVVVEVGPGLGVLTERLLEKAGKVVAIELDDKLAPLLKERLQSDKLELIHEDILKVNLNEIVEKLSEYKVVANIPYYITSKILQLLLTMEKKPSMIILLVQKEVAERICAKPGEMSVLSLSVQAFGDPQIVQIVNKNSFFPSPEVDSAILKIDNISYKFSQISEKELFRVIKIGFASRRKTLLNNLSAGLRIDKNKAKDIMKSAVLKEGARAQELSLADWTRLASLIS
jgi:16S rRNA (adenine1518-N6/adenine1519-N6)-dimethyltransferase